MVSGVEQKVEVKQGDIVCLHRGLYYLNIDGLKLLYNEIDS